jgi:lipopolysaccharide/colanic/teichoic acid biosynthesis glycosyltransferase
VALHNDSRIGRQSRARVLADFVPTLGIGRCAKRLFDIVGATTSLLLLSPIILVISVAVKLDSRGSIFSRETLYGYRNQIRVLKFRSMTVCTETNRLNLRVTRVGQVLRRTGIDELPQLLNVLRGEMSIVGPCAYTSRHDLLDNQLLPLLSGVKPGMTGWAQITESREGFRTTEQRINDDLHYVENWSLFLDFKIILMTVFFQKQQLANAGEKIANRT